MKFEQRDVDHFLALLLEFKLHMVDTHDGDGLTYAHKI